ncbi:RNA polymerase sigma factor 54 interaction domain protein [Acididesulfobacillus acetoxydans]|uniref:Nif-specific regulatory protein n=1 Tax=Acididesulfobacillus acetoxydans TaxID=1561005 RepID=A0A8S0X464_9FIRM|nr:sigma 54-interacting transcriptional regulator [Acididesulfobacillus acetoxydans]CAA7600600.1 RNA polymerase sigma factor 54 interaction domain protein [Acididesulfobacillus acetoxydans]CEJ09381.1 Nif-specific regulatory protein [Acididesulfobacillus acetoxydans]
MDHSVSQKSFPTQKLQLAQDLLYKILENSYDEIFVIDGAGRIVYVNNACVENYGLQPSEIIGRSIWWFYERGYCLPTTPVALRKKERVTLETITSIGKRLVVTSTPVLDSHGNIELVVANSRDITQIDQIKQDYEQTKLLLQKYRKEVTELRKKELLATDFVAHSKQMRNIVELAQRVAPTDSTILITGESGTGKGVMAKYIHKMSKRKGNAFIHINCAAIPDQLFESELFGYAPGAFTGADKHGKVGLLELAQNGTVFLDEIGEIPLRLQAKLLEVMQELRFIDVGGRNKKEVNVRIIAATNRDLRGLVKQGFFRGDLYYRLNVIEVEMPPLRERVEDILPLVVFYLKKINHIYETKHSFSQASLELLLRYHWPGNVRELEHVIERLAITVPETTIEVEHLAYLFRQVENEDCSVSLPALIPLDAAVERVEKYLVIKAFRQLGSSYKVAEALKISQTKASRLIRKYCSVQEFEALRDRG